MAKNKQVGDTGTEAPVVEETPIETEIKATTVETVATEDQALETETGNAEAKTEETTKTETETTTVETVATEDEELETETEGEDVAYVATRPLLHGGKPYKAGEDVTGLFSEDEANRLLKMGVIEEA